MAKTRRTKGEGSYDKVIDAKGHTLYRWRMNWNGHRCYLHVYHDSLKAEIASKRFDRELLSCYEELVQGRLIANHAEHYRKFFLVKDTPKRGRKVEYN